MAAPILVGSLFEKRETDGDGCNGQALSFLDSACMLSDDFEPCCGVACHTIVPEEEVKSCLFLIYSCHFIMACTGALFML